MFRLKSSGEFIETLRAIDEKLFSLRLSAINISKKERAITYNFICTEYIDETLREKVMTEVEKTAPSEFRFVTVNIKKIATNDELINNAIFNFIKENFPSASIFLKLTDVVCAIVGDTVKYTLRLPSVSADYMKRSGAINKINDFLAKNFCADFAGIVEIKEDEETVDLTSEDVFVSELEKIQRRTIKVDSVTVIDDRNMGDIALYIEDLVEGETAVICGKITEIFEKQSKNGKPFLIIHISDGTATTSGLYFSYKYTWEQIRCLQVGDEIIARGKIETYNDRASFKFEKINRCVFPKDFVKQDKFKKKPPKEYSLIFPKQVSTLKVKSVFDAEYETPDVLLDNEFVVFDLETTGIEVTTNGITEIGAVKIKGGKIVEEFTSLIKPDYPITEKIIELTGITPEMVKDAPRISAVLPDFMKFISGSILVAHNAEFDTKFIRRFAHADEYDLPNKVMDTLEMSRRLLPFLRKHDLHTLGEHFNVMFRHHRALSDAYATAEIFIELMKIQEAKTQG